MVMGQNWMYQKNHMKIGASFKLHLRSDFESLQVVTWVVAIIVCARKQEKLIFALCSFSVWCVFLSEFLLCPSFGCLQMRQILFKLICSSSEWNKISPMLTVTSADNLPERRQTFVSRYFGNLRKLSFSHRGILRARNVRKKELNETLGIVHDYDRNSVDRRWSCAIIFNCKCSRKLNYDRDSPTSRVGCRYEDVRWFN